MAVLRATRGKVDHPALHGPRRRTHVLRSLIQETARVLKAVFPQSIKVETDIPDHLRTICSNGTHLYQVLLNLCLNARDAMPSGGRLRIGAANVVLDETAGGSLPEANQQTYVSIRVADTGTRIPDDIRSKILGAFFYNTRSWPRQGSWTIQCGQNR